MNYHDCGNAAGKIVCGMSLIHEFSLAGCQSECTIIENVLKFYLVADICVIDCTILRTLSFVKNREHCSQDLWTDKRTLSYVEPFVLLLCLTNLSHFYRQRQSDDKWKRDLYDDDREPQTSSISLVKGKWLQSVAFSSMYLLNNVNSVWIIFQRTQSRSWRSPIQASKESFRPRLSRW